MPNKEPTTTVSSNSANNTNTSNTALAPLPPEIAMPTAAIMRLVKAKMPDKTHCAADAKLAFQKAASLFALYLTTLAADASKDDKRSTVTAQDVLRALRDLEYDELVPEMELCLAAFREAEKKRSIENAAKRQKRADDGEDAAEGEGEDDGENEVEVDDDAEAGAP